MKKDSKEVIYLGEKIIAWLEKVEEFNKKNNKVEIRKYVHCNIYRKKSKNQPLILGQCNDGGKLTSVNQAINQAKSFIDCCNSLKI